jgi:hypothetical protein
MYFIHMFEMMSHLVMCSAPAPPGAWHLPPTCTGVPVTCDRNRLATASCRDKVQASQEWQEMF